MKMQRYLLYIASLAVCMLLVLSACGGPTPIAGGVTETVTPASPTTVAPSTEPPKSTGSPTAHVSPSPAATATEVNPTPGATPSATSAPTSTETPTPVVEIKAGAFTLRQVSIENNSAISNTIAPYVSFDGKFGAPYAGFEGTHGPELFKDRVFQDAKGTIFVLPSGSGDVSQQLAWLEKYTDIANIKSGAITSSEYTPLGKGKVVIVAPGAVFVYPDNSRYESIIVPKIIRQGSSGVISGKILGQLGEGNKFVKRIWWNEQWQTIVASDNNTLITHKYNPQNNQWDMVNLFDPVARLRTQEQVVTDWKKEIEGNIVGFSPEEKKKLLQYFDALHYVKPEKTAQILKLFPWFHAPFSPDNPLRFLVDVQQIINNKGKGIWGGAGSPEVKLDLAFLPNCSEETNWWTQVAGLMKEAMTNRWTLRYTANFLKDEHYGDLAAAALDVAVQQDLLDARKENGTYVISNPQTRRELRDLMNGYIYGFNQEAKRNGWTPSFP